MQREVVCFENWRVRHMQHKYMLLGNTVITVMLGILKECAASNNTKQSSFAPSCLAEHRPAVLQQQLLLDIL